MLHPAALYQSAASALNRRARKLTASAAPARQARVVGGIGLEHRQRDHPGRVRGGRDVAPAGVDRGVQRARRLVDDAAHRRVDELLPQHPQAAVVQLGRALRRAHQPAHDRHARQRLHQRGDAVGIAEVGLGARGLDRRGSAPRSRVVPRTAWPGRAQLARQRLPAAAAADDQHPGHLEVGYGRRPPVRSGDAAPPADGVGGGEHLRRLLVRVLRGARRTSSRARPRPSGASTPRGRGCRARTRRRGQSSPR